MSSSADLQWFPLRVTYNRELKIKREFDRLGITNYLPMTIELKGENGMQESVLVPAIHNLIFAQSTQEILTNLKMENREFEPIRYMMRRSTDGKTTILTIPDYQMDNFIKVTSVHDSSVKYLECSDYVSKVGKKVRITAGQFKDVVGVIKRIKKNRYFVVQIEGVAAVAITYIPKEFIEEVKHGSI